MSLFSCPTIEAQTDRITLSDPCFISDLHLNAESKIQSDFFVRFLNEVAQQHSELIILGDFLTIGWETMPGTAPLRFLNR